MERRDKSKGPGILGEIVERRRESVEVSKRKKTISDIKSMIREDDGPRGFEGALKSNGDIKLICEIKRKSPSRGMIRKDFDPISLARSFEEGGARRSRS